MIEPESEPMVSETDQKMMSEEDRNFLDALTRLVDSHFREHRSLFLVSWGPEGKKLNVFHKRIRESEIPYVLREVAEHLRQAREEATRRESTSGKAGV